MIDTHIDNRNDAIRLVNELAIIAGRCTNSCPISEKENLRDGLEALKDAIEREVV